MLPVVFILCFVTFSSVNGGSPDVSLFASEAKEKANVVLTCLATGFYPKDITMNIRRDGRILTEDDGVVTSGVQPNENNTHQRRDHVEIPRADVATYTCEIIHPGSNMHVEKPWEKHSLTYIYTAFSHPVKLPGIHEFTAMGLLDNRMIDYYDSSVQKKIPKQDWMKERLQQEYWEKGTQSRQSKQQWFKVNIDILINRMRQTSNDTHVLQWMHGCEGVEDGHGNLQFMSGVDMYNYDGDDFLAFDDEHQIWVATLDAAVPTKRKWDEVTALKDYTKGYLEKECMEWMNTFLSYSKQQLKSASSPDVFLFASEAKEKANVVLTCLATGFYPKDITMNIRRDGRILTKDDGVVSSGVRPNQDDTHQRRDHVEILRTDVASYTCEIIHPGSNMHVEKPWDHRLPTEENFPIAPTAAIAVILVLIGIILFVLYKRGIIGRRSQADPVSVETNGEKLHFIGGGDAGPSSSSSSGSNESISKDSAVGRDDEGEPLIGVHISEDGKQMERKSSNESISKDSAVGGDAGPSSSSSSSGSNESISKDSAVGGDSGSNSA